MTNRSSEGDGRDLGVDVLVVDDDEHYRASCAELMRRAGYSVEEAEDAFVALERLSSTRVGVLVLDVRMPGLDGLRLLDKLDDKLDDVPPPVLLVTAYPIGDQVVARNLRYLRKPVPPTDLLAAIAELRRTGRGAPEGPHRPR